MEGGDEEQGREAFIARDSLPTDAIDYDPMPSNESLSSRPHRNLKDVKKLGPPPTTRYLTFQVQNLPSLRLIGKNDPMITVWDSYLEAYVGTTEVVKQVFSTEFEEVIAVKHYAGVDQTLQCSVFNASSSSVTLKDLIGSSSISLDTLLNMQGTEVPMSITHRRDPKVSAKLTKAKASTIVHLRALDTYSFVIKSGWILVRELPLFMGTKEVTPLVKRFMVISMGRISHYRTVFEFFQEGATGKSPADKFSVLVADCKLAFEPQDQRMWGVECEKLAKRFEFTLTEYKDEGPNVCPGSDDSESSYRGGKKPDPEFFQRKALWLLAVQTHSSNLPQRQRALSSPEGESAEHPTKPQTKEQEFFQEVMEEVLEVVPLVEPFETTMETDALFEDEELKQPQQPQKSAAARKIPTVPAITRYLTMKVKNLPNLFLIAKPDPMLTIWDSMACAYVGKTEIVRQTFNADFEQVFAIKHYPSNDQSLTVNVFSVSGDKLSSKDTVGCALVALDSLLGMEGVDVSVPITNLKDPKMHTKLVKAKSAVIFHLRPEISLVSVIHSGWILAREMPSVLQKKDKPPPFLRRFLVVLNGRMQHYASVIDYFEDAAERSVTDRVVISLSDARPILFDQLPKPQGKLALDGRRENAWAVECTLTGKRYEFDIVEVASMEAPNLAAEELKLLEEQNTSTEVAKSSARRDRWLQAIRLAISQSKVVPATRDRARSRAFSTAGARARSPSATRPQLDKSKERENFGIVMQEVLDVVPVIDPTVESDSKDEGARGVVSPRSIPTVIEAEAEAPAVQDSKLDESGKQKGRKKTPTQPGVIRYLTFRVKELPPVRLLTKNDPMVTVWDTHLESYAGTTEVKAQTYNPDFEDVISVCHYMDIDQMLRVGVFNCSGSTITSKDFIGNSVIPLDTLLNFEGSEVPIPMSNARDSKLHLKLQKSRSSIHVHLRPNSHLVGIIKSGHLNVRSVPRKGKPTPWTKRFVVLTDGQLAHYRNLFDFFQDRSQSRAELDRVCVTLTGKVTVCDPLPKVPGVTSKPDSWGVDCSAEGKRYEFEMTEVFVEEFPNLCSEADPISQRTNVAHEKKQPEAPATRRKDWVGAMLVAIPTTIFGIPLEFAAARSDKAGKVPSPITIAIKWLDENALTETGLYRIPGGKTEVEGLIARFDSGEDVEIPKQYFGGNLASLVVQFLRRLPDGLFTSRMAPVFEQMSQDGQLKMLKLLLSKLPRCNFCTLRALIQHLVRVANNCSVNEMTIENLSICVITSMASTMNALMTNADFLFDQEEPQE